VTAATVGGTARTGRRSETTVRRFIKVTIDLDDAPHAQTVPNHLRGENCSSSSEQTFNLGATATIGTDITCGKKAGE
jgi:hypothetical protein